jgi:cytochrome c biogenesis protein
MKLIKIQKVSKLLVDLKFAIGVLALIALASSLGSFIEQDEPSFFYEENYPLDKPIYGFITYKLILFLGLDHVYITWWFLTLLIILGISLIGCTITRQFPLLQNSKEYFFRKQEKSFLNLPFAIKLKKSFYLKETILLKFQKLNLYTYQNGNLIYGYKGLIGRISPILVHLSLIIILTGSSIGAFKNFKAQEILPKAEIFHVQNPIRIGFLTALPNVTTRVNDFWVEYKNNKINQFYSNLSILDSYGNEIKTQTISVNNPLRYKSIDFYQSDWNLLGIRVKKINDKQTYEYPVFPLNKNTKSWITWVNSNNKNTTVIFDQFQQTFLTYDENGNFLNVKNLGDLINNEFSVIDILPATGLLIKYDPSIIIIYIGFGLLMITTLFSYLPYTQFWSFEDSKNIWIGSSTNRGKIQLEIEFENLIRKLENKLYSSYFISTSQKKEKN